MVLRLLCTTVAAAALAAVFSAGSQTLEAAESDLYYNYYVAPTICGGGAGAQLYPSPRPTPAMVGHTYVTYQPLLPHEFLYHHARTYYNFHPNGQITRTKIHWH